MKILKFFLIFLFFICYEIEAQTTVFYYSSVYGVLDTNQDALYKKEIFKKSSRKTKVISYQLENEQWVKVMKEIVRKENDTLLQIKRPGDKIWKQRILRSYFPTLNNLYSFTDRTLKGVTILEGSATRIIPLHKQDTVRSYYTKTAIKSIAVFENNRLISNENWLKNGSKYISDLHYYVDQVPEYSNGQANFRAYIINGIIDAGIDLSQVSDRVVIGWTVMENGELRGFHKLSGVYSQLNSTLIKLISEMPGEWIPAKVGDTNVRYYMQLPFNFIDRSEKFETLELNSGFMSWD